MFEWLVPVVIQLDKFFNYYDPGRPHQRAAIQKLQEDMPPELLSHEAEWFEIWKAGGKVAPFKVPYFNQMDLPMGHRMCFTSAMAMVAAHYGAVQTQEEYSKVRAKYGDTIEVTAQLRALEELGLRPQFIQDGTPDELEAEIDAGRVVAVGWMTQGSIDAGMTPSGIGHWGVVVGYTEKFWIVMDPRGRYDLREGRLVEPGKGEGVFYDRKLFAPRWSPEGPGHGWAILVDPLPPPLIP